MLIFFFWYLTLHPDFLKKGSPLKKQISDYSFSSVLKLKFVSLSSGSKGHWIIGYRVIQTLKLATY